MRTLEEDAPIKWCPFVRCGDSFDANPPAANCTAGPDGSRVPDWAGCIGTRCMAWRHSPRIGPLDQPEGYCGLAGKVD
jgi:hypothetical protein